MECRGATSQSCSVEHVGIPTLAALRQAVDALEDMDMKRGTVQRSLYREAYALVQMLRPWHWALAPYPLVRAY